MHTRGLSLLLATVGSLTILTNSAPACTEVVLNKTKGLVISGRTMDFDSELGSKVCFRPSGTKITDPGLQYSGVKYAPMTWTTKYNTVMIDAFDQPAYADGMNNEGLAMSTLWQNETEPAKAVEPGKKGLANIALVEYVLENAKDVDDAKKLISALSVVDSKFNGMEMVLHWIITDKNGRSVVVELKGGHPIFFDQAEQVGVLTNSPSYDNQLANLKSQNDARQKDKTYTLPGDYEPKSRFVKAAYLVSTTPELKSPDAGMTTAMQILHNVEVPKGAQQTGSYTQWIVVRDQTNLRYWLTGVNNPTPKKIDLKTLDFSKLATQRIPADGPVSSDHAQLLGSHSMNSNATDVH